MEKLEEELEEILPEIQDSLLDQMMIFSFMERLVITMKMKTMMIKEMMNQIQLQKDRRFKLITLKRVNLTCKVKSQAMIMNLSCKEIFNMEATKLSLKGKKEEI